MRHGDDMATAVSRLIDIENLPDTRPERSALGKCAMVCKLSVLIVTGIGRYRQFRPAKTETMAATSGCKLPRLLEPASTVE